MPDITFTLSAGAVTRVKDAMLSLYPVPTDEAGVPLFADNVWAKEALRRIIKREVRRAEQKVAQDAAGAAVVEMDDADIT